MQLLSNLFKLGCEEKNSDVISLFATNECRRIQIIDENN